MRGRLSLLIGAAGLALTLRAPTPSAPPSTAPREAAVLETTVDISGCHAVLHDGACEVGEGQLHAWSDAGAVYEIDGAPVAAGNPIDVQGGTLVELTVPRGARELRVRGAQRRSTILRFAAAPSERASVARARQLRDAHDLDGARAALEGDREAAEREGAAGPLLSLLARLKRAQEHDEEADALFGEAIDAYAREGRDSDAANDGFALGFSLVRRWHFERAREVLEQASLRSKRYADGRARYGYYAGMLATAVGDSRTALRDYRIGSLQAERVGLRRLHELVRRQADVELDLHGRSDEALADLQALDASDGASMSACDRADLEVHVAWVALHVHAARIDPREWERRALERYATECTTPAEPSAVAETLGDLARAELEAGRPAEARARLVEASRRTPHPPMVLSLEWLETRGDVALAEKRAGAASVAFDELLAKADAAGVLAWQLTALEGAAEARALRGDTQGALAKLARASDVVARQSAAITLGEGRESFVRAHERADVRRVQLLVALGRPQDALRAVREIRARLLDGIQATDRVASLSPEARAGWDAAIGAYRRERDAIDEAAANDWTFASDSLAKRRDARAKHAAAVQADLDGALAHVAPSTVEDRAPRAPLPGELVLAYFPTDRGWLGFAATEARTRVVDLGAVDVKAPAADLAGRMVDPFSDEIEAASRISVIASGEAWRVDVHALAWRGAPLVARAPVVYPIDRRTLSRDDDSATDALVVGDPTEDLRGARADLALVEHALGATPGAHVTTLRGRAATGDAVRTALATTGLFHYSGHGVFAGRDGVEARLPLADDGALTTTDILALPHAPARVILLGCETARESGDAHAAGLGLAQAFVMAGSHAVVAATRDVNDAATSAIAASLYVSGVRDLPEALRAAQLTAASRGVGDWSAFRVLVP